MIIETRILDISCKRKKPKTEQKINCPLRDATLPNRNRTYGKRLSICIFFLLFLGLSFCNAMGYEEWSSGYSVVTPSFQESSLPDYPTTFQNNLPSEYYSLEKGLFSENLSADSRANRSLPEIEDGDNGLGLVPIGGKETYIFSAFAMLYFLVLLCRRILYAKRNEQ